MPAFTLIPGRLSTHGSIRIAPLRHLCQGNRLVHRAISAKSSSHAQLYIPKPPSNERITKLTFPLLFPSFLAEPGGNHLGEWRGEISWGGIDSGSSSGKKASCLSLRSPCTMSKQIPYVLQKPSSAAVPSLITSKDNQTEVSYCFHWVLITRWQATWNKGRWERSRVKGRKSLYLPANLHEFEEQFCAPRADLKIQTWSKGGKRAQVETDRIRAIHTGFGFKIKFPFKRGKLKTLRRESGWGQLKHMWRDYRCLPTPYYLFRILKCKQHRELTRQQGQKILSWNYRSGNKHKRTLHDFQHVVCRLQGPWITTMESKLYVWGL